MDVTLAFKHPWKDHQVGDTGTYNEVIAEELISSGIAENANAEASRQSGNTVSRIYHVGKLQRLKNERAFLMQKVEKLDAQIEFEEEYLKNTPAPVMKKRAAAK